MPPRPSRADTSGLNDTFGDEDLFAGLEPFRLPANLEPTGNVASGSGSHTVMDREFGAAGTSDMGDAGFVMEEMDLDRGDRKDTLIPDLIRLWTNERLAPDILDQRGELIQRVLVRIQEQVCGLCVFFSP